MNSTEFAAFIDKAIEQNPIEAKIITQIVEVCAAAGNPVVSVWDGYEDTEVTNLRSIQEQVFNLDEAHLYTRSGAYVFVVMGNEWDVLSDYNVSLEDTLKPVNDYIQKYMV